ncbi:MAG: hypothetical protein Q9220_001292, partial [cf. Caloplaca sp. 1 TL-2023]
IVDFLHTMRTFTISAALLLLTSLVSTAPVATQPETRQFDAFITFYGADTDAYYTRIWTADGSSMVICQSLYFESPLCSFGTDGGGGCADNPLSISHIGSAGGATCSFFGVDGSETRVVGAQVVDVGPPQVQVSGYCVAL